MLLAPVGPALCYAKSVGYLARKRKSFRDFARYVSSRGILSAVKAKNVGGRPPKVPGERRRIVGISMSPRAIADLRSLSEIRGESQGDVIETLVVRALKAARRKSDGPA